MKITRQSFALFVVLSLAISGNAFAHAHLESSNPAKDATVNSVPSTVTLHFSEELESSMSKLEVKDLDTGKTVSTGKPAYVNGDKSALQISVNDPAAVSKKTHFEVSWKAVSKDSHKMPGKYEFTFDPSAKTH
jgi:methionine-rich copper-binding protein CopC